MTRRVYRYFFDALAGQEKWLNRMAAKGWRLVGCSTLSYLFEPCEPGAYEYAVDLAGDRSAAEARDYGAFLNALGYKVITKNLNANWSVGHVRWRPWARGGGQLATTAGNFNRELFLVEKPADGRPFRLHSSREDALSACRSARNMYLWAVGAMLVLMAVTFLGEGDRWTLGLNLLRGVLLVFCVLWGVPLARTAGKVRTLKEEKRIEE